MQSYFKMLQRKFPHDTHISFEYMMRVTIQKRVKIVALCQWDTSWRGRRGKGGRENKRTPSPKQGIKIRKKVMTDRMICKIRFLYWKIIALPTTPRRTM